MNIDSIRITKVIGFVTERIDDISKSIYPSLPGDSEDLDKITDMLRSEVGIERGYEWEPLEEIVPIPDDDLRLLLERAQNAEDFHGVSISMSSEMLHNLVGEVLESRASKKN